MSGIKARIIQIAMALVKAIPVFLWKLRSNRKSQKKLIEELKDELSIEEDPDGINGKGKTGTPQTIRENDLEERPNSTGWGCSLDGGPAQHAARGGGLHAV